MTHYDPIQTRFLRSRDFFALRYREGLVFLEVEEFEDTDLENFSELEDVESGTSLDGGYQELQDSNNDDVLFVPSDDKFVVHHVGIGIAPSMLEMHVGYPTGTRSRGSLPNVSTQPTPGSDIGGISGKESPYREPSVRSELVIPPKQHVEFDFQNPGNDDHEPILNIVFRKYRVNVLNPTEKSNKNAIKRIVSPGSPAPIFTVGNFRDKADFNLESEWQVSPVKRKNANQGGGR